MTIVNVLFSTCINMKWNYTFIHQLKEHAFEKNPFHITKFHGRVTIWNITYLSSKSMHLRKTLFTLQFYGRVTILNITLFELRAELKEHAFSKNPFHIIILWTCHNLKHYLFELRAAAHYQWWSTLFFPLMFSYGF